jgi:pimeloyl-ACP methyl ester carboxylesterase
MRALEPDYQVLRYDTRGHGSTDPEVREVPGTRYFFGDDERQEGQDPNWAYTIMKNL